MATTTPVKDTKFQGNTSPKKPATNIVSAQSKGEFTPANQAIGKLDDFKVQVTMDLSPAQNSRDLRTWFEDIASKHGDMHFKMLPLTENGDFTGAYLEISIPKGEEREIKRYTMETSNMEDTLFMKRWATQYQELRGKGELNRMGNSTAGNTSGGQRGRISDDDRNAIVKAHTDENVSVADLATKYNRKPEAIQALIDNYKKQQEEATKKIESGLPAGTDNF